MEDKTYEFEIEMRVRKRLWFSGPTSAEQARRILKEALEGGMNPNTFAKRGEDGHPIEQIVSNDFSITTKGGGGGGGGRGEPL